MHIMTNVPALEVALSAAGIVLANVAAIVGIELHARKAAHR